MWHLLLLILLDFTLKIVVFIKIKPVKAIFFILFYFLVLKYICVKDPVM